MENSKIVQGLYEAFGKGDIPAILQHLADNIEWEYGVNSTDVPWFQPHRGRGEVAKFFEALGALDFHKFVPKTFCETGNIVVALVDVEVTVRATGRKIVEEDEVHLWHFEQGQVVRFRHRADTHQEWMAYHG